MKHEPGKVRIGAHTKQQRYVALAPDLDAWVMQEAKLVRCSFSEMVNRLLSQQHDLRQQLAALTETQPQKNAPLFHVIMEQFAGTLCRSLDALAGEVQKTSGELNFLKAMIDRSTHALLHAAVPGDGERRYEHWILGVQSLTHQNGRAR